MASGDEREETPDSGAVYRSRRAALRERIASTEGELAELRAELRGLPEERDRRFWIGLGAFTAIALVALGILYLLRRPDRFTFTPTLSNGGWALTFEFTKPIRCIDVLVEGRDGKRDRVDCMTSSTLPNVANASLTMDLGRTPSTLTVEYEVGGTARRVSTPFNPWAAQIDQVKHSLNIVGQWVEGRDYQGRRLLYFSTLLSYGFVLDEIRYGFDDGPLDKTVRFQRRDSLGISTDDELYRVIPESIESVTVELTFVDKTILRRRVPVMPKGGARD